MGKIVFDELRDLLRCIKRTPEVIVPPTPGFDGGVHKIGDDMCMVVATDPCTGVPDEWFGWLLVNYSASDVAAFGVQPRFCTINLLGPPGTEQKDFKRVMEQVCKAVEELNMTIIAGHTGTYKGLTNLVATCTSYGIVQIDRLITPEGIRPGDYLICTKPLGLEILANFVLTHRTQAEEMYGRERARDLTGQIRMQTCVREALALAETKGVSAMHDVTEGGLTAALNEMADASGVGFRIDFANIPTTPELQILRDRFRLSWKQVLSMSSTGTLLAAISPDKMDKAVAALSRLGLDAPILGVFSEGRRRLITYDGREMEFPREIDDPYTLIISAK